MVLCLSWALSFTALSSEHTGLCDVGLQIWPGNTDNNCIKLKALLWGWRDNDTKYHISVSHIANTEYIQFTLITFNTSIQILLKYAFSWKEALQEGRDLGPHEILGSFKRLLSAFSSLWVWWYPSQTMTVLSCLKVLPTVMLHWFWPELRTEREERWHLRHKAIPWSYEGKQKEGPSLI